MACKLFTAALVAMALLLPLVAAEGDSERRPQPLPECPKGYEWACKQCEGLSSRDSYRDCLECVGLSVKNRLNIEWACASCGSGDSGDRARTCVEKTGTNNVDACKSCKNLSSRGGYLSDQEDCFRCVEKLGPLGTGVAYSCDDCGESNECRTCLEKWPGKAWACLQCKGARDYDACVYCKGGDYDKCYRCRTTTRTESAFNQCMRY